MSTLHTPIPASRRLRLVFSLVAAILLLGGLGFGVRVRTMAFGAGPTYTVAALDDHLARVPAAWLHRTVSLRAALGGKCMAMAGLYTPSCASWSLALTDPDRASGAAPLVLSWGSAPALLAAMRRVPLLREAALAPQILHSGEPAVYRVQLQRAECAATEAPPCYGVVLLDAPAPDNTTDWIQIKGRP